MSLFQPNEDFFLAHLFFSLGIKADGIYKYQKMDFASIKKKLIKLIKILTAKKNPVYFL